MAQQTKIVPSNGNPQAAKLDGNDAELLAIRNMTQAQLSEFVDSLAKYRNDDNYHFIIKSDFHDSVNHEHMWTAIFKYEHGVFGGLLLDSIFVLKNIKKGDKVFIRKEDVEDWVIYDGIHKTQIGYFSENICTVKCSSNSFIYNFNLSTPNN